MAQVVCAAAYVAAYHVRIVAFNLARIKGMARQYQVAKARSKSFYLPLYPLGHINGRAMRDVAVGPAGMLSLGRARVVEKALLREEYEGAFGVPAL